MTLDDCKFHECVDLAEFERDRVIVIHPPDGEVCGCVWGEYCMGVTLSEYVGGQCVCAH